ncbi:alpha/beta hydrolase [bacterium]|nr:alpha/beta hydrolase [bacterium]
MKREYFTRYVDNECVIIAKLFRAPITNYYKHLIRLKKEGKFHYNIDFNFEFYLRFYFPKKQMTTINSKSERLIIMFNGLNEVNDVNFSLYDRLGKSFASMGFPSVLFPTPFHLNRSAIDNRNFKNYNDWEERPHDFSKKLIKIPTVPLKKRPYCLYMNYIQIIYEYNIFRHLIDHEFNRVKRCDSYNIPKVNKEEKYFYNQHFTNKKTEVNLLGYSLGGLYALSCFSKNPDNVNSCTLLNAGASLDQMNLTKFVKKDVWEKIANNLKTVNNWGCDPEILSDILTDPNYGIINNVFFDSPLKDEIDRVGKKLLFIMGWQG